MTISPIELNKPMFGPLEPSESINTPKYKISLNTNGFDYFKKNKLRKAIAWLQESGLEQYIPQVTTLANEMPFIKDHIDIAYENRLNEWVKASLPYNNAIKFDPKKLHITIEPQPFHIPFYGPTATFSGTVDVDKNGIYRARIVVCHIHSSLQFLQTYRNLAEWEIGNAFQLFCVGRPARLEEEIGNRNPVSLIK